MDNLILKISHITKSFVSVNRKPDNVISDVSFEVQKGEFVCILGPSGCGKSTLLRIIAGLIPADEGKIIKQPEQLEQAMVFQNAAIFPWLNTEENIAFGLKMQGASNDKIRDTIQREIKQMKLDDARSLHPRELSGGMKQRVGIARALALDPDLLLLDEPFSSLDAFTAEKLRNDVIKIWQIRKQSVVMITHIVEEAVQLADKIVVLTSHPGKVKEIITVDIKRHRNERSKEFYDIVDHIKSLIVVD
ncbi:MAG: ABC transporter ATP-binding protein [bacterium]